MSNLRNVYDPWPCHLQGTDCTGKTENGHENDQCQGKHRILEIWKFGQNTGNLVCSSCKFRDSKGKIYFNIIICCDNFLIFFEAGLVCQVSFVYVIVVNCHRENLQLIRK